MTETNLRAHMKNARLRILIIGGLLFGLVFFSQNIAWFLTDWMWFDSLGLSDVFATTFLARIGTGGIVGLIGAAIIFINGAVALKSTRNYGFQLPGQLAGSPLESSLNQINLLIPVGVVAVLLGLLIGLSGVVRVENTPALWEEVLLFFYGTDFNHTETVFGLDASFYVFRLPLYVAAVGLLTGSIFLSGVLSVGVYFLRGAVGVSMREVDGRFVPQGAHIHAPVRKHLGVLLGIWLLLLSVSALLARYTLMYDQGGLFAGPGYSDLYGTLPSLYVKAAGLAIAAVLVAIGVTRGQVRWLVSGGVFGAAGWALAATLPGFIQSIKVEPNVRTLEVPQIDHHIAGTQAAFQLRDVEERKLDGQATLSMDDINNNQGTIQNIRLWDHGQLLDTFSKLQEIRTYYRFANVDNDRYMVDGQLRQIMLSPRELVTSGLDAKARSWQNETMTYTHGYGMALGPVNEKTENGGLPVLFIEDLPPKVSKSPETLEINQAALYYGETMDEEVFVNTSIQEFDYPSLPQDAYTHYSGTGGVSTESIFTRALLSLRMGTAKVILNSDFKEGSKILMYRDIRKRVNRIAPFLRLDHDPYLIIDEGRLVWMIDAYTYTNRFPYSQSLVNIGNYMRNSVKITVDAYNGNLVFYQMDSEDPIINAWGRVFPNLLTPGEDMPDSLREHIRYPSDYFRVQAHLFATYHMTDPLDFYQREDQWEVPVVQGRQMEPYYTVMKVPGEKTEEFILMLPFVPKNRPNLAAWMVARADGEHYGQMVAYTFPKESMVYGPEMIVARINQDDTISEKLSLWNQQGSQAVLGTLMVIPIEEALIYAAPLYLRADTDSIPELRRVIVGYKDQIAMEPTLDEALARIFDGSVQPILPPNDSVEGGGEDAPSTVSASATSAQRAHSAWLKAKTAAEQGNWAEYGEEIERLGILLTGLANPAQAADATPNGAASNETEEPTE